MKPELVAALKKDVPVLRSAKLVGDVDVDAFREQVRAYFADNLDAEQHELYESLHAGS